MFALVAADKTGFLVGNDHARPAARPMTLEGNINILVDTNEHDESDQASALDTCVRRCVKRYLRDMGEHEPDQLYKLFLLQFDRAMLEEVLDYADDNQTRASRILGLNRGTLRKKISQLDNDQ